jgi:hypothetical protein
VGDGVNLVVFEFRKNGMPMTGRLPIDISAMNLDESGVADAIVTAVNAAPALGVIAVKATMQPYVRLINDAPGGFGNVPLVQNSGGALGLFGMSGGFARDCATDGGCKVNDDCLSLMCAGKHCQ